MKSIDLSLLFYVLLGELITGIIVTLHDFKPVELIGGALDRSICKDGNGGTREKIWRSRWRIITLLEIAALLIYIFFIAPDGANNATYRIVCYTPFGMIMDLLNLLVAPKKVVGEWGSLLLSAGIGAYFIDLLKQRYDCATRSELTREPDDEGAALSDKLIHRVVYGIPAMLFISMLCSELIPSLSPRAIPQWFVESCRAEPSAICYLLPLAFCAAAILIPAFIGLIRDIGWGVVCLIGVCAVALVVTLVLELLRASQTVKDVIYWIFGFLGFIVLPFVVPFLFDSIKELAAEEDPEKAMAWFWIKSFLIPGYGLVRGGVILVRGKEESVDDHKLALLGCLLPGLISFAGIALGLAYLLSMA